MRSMANDKTMGPDELPVELKLGLSESSYEILFAFHGIIVAVGKCFRLRDRVLGV